MYDDYGNLTYVLPPKLNGTIASLSTINANLEAIGFKYTNDGRNRLVEKQIPGKVVEYVVYNKLDQPILTQDANQRVNNEWLFTKYDAFGRVAYTGKAIDSRERTRVQAEVNAYTGQLWVNRVAFTSLGGAPIYYSNHGYPNANSTTGLSEVLTIQYYDNYDFPELLQGQVPSNLESWEVPVDFNAKGLPTVSQTKVLSTSGDWISSAIAYDHKGRVIWSYSGNSYLNTTTIVATQLDFPGRVTGTYTLHQKQGETDLVTIDTYSYDGMGRLKKHLQQIGDYNQPAEVIAENTYDALGQLISKGVGNTDGGTRLQTVTYEYNIRGWLKKINDPTSLGTNLFGFEIKYNDIVDPTKKLYNGNISQTLWNTQSVNPTTNPVSTQYTYSYDALNRITGAVDNTTNYNLSGITYDQNGNILTLQRQGYTNASATLFGTMDNLVYTYDRGNKLTKVLDNESDTHGFKDGANTATEYIYDTNGNMISDANKGISSIEYNHLNMPTKVTVTGANAGVLDYVYSADGVKLQKKKTQGGSIITTDYAGNYVYENGALQFFNHVEGYAMPKDINDYSQGFDYVYQYRDHLGNVRLSYTDANNDGNITTTEIIEENSYYPFGVKHQGYNNNVSSLGNSNAQRWKYQGQELTEDLGLDVYEFRYRMHDPAIGRFWQIDPLAEDYMYNSTYAFQENKLGIGIELEGLEVSRHEWLDDNGQNNIRYDAQIKVLINSSASIDQVIDYANNIAGKIENDFSGTDSDGNNVSTSVSLEFVAEADPENDFYIEFTDQVIDPDTGNAATAEGRVDVIGDAEVNRMQVLIPGKSGASYGEPVTEDRLPLTGAHEYGHTVGLDHQVGSSNKSPRGLTVGPNNLMRSSNSLNRQRGGVNGGQLSVLQNTVNTPLMVNFRQQMRQSQQKFEKTMNKILNPKL